MNYNPPTLWDAGQIAEYLRVDRRTVLEKYVVRQVRSFGHRLEAQE